MSMSTYLEQAILNHILRGDTGSTEYTQPSTIYMSLHTDASGEGAGANEVSGNAYARVSVAFDAAEDGSGNESKCINSDDVFFPVATGSWGTVTHFGLWDASTSGNLLFAGELAVEHLVATSNQIKIAAGTLTVTLD